MLEKIDIHNTEKNYSNALVRLKKDISKKNYDLIIKFLDASSIGQTARLNASTKQVGVRARLKNLYLLKIVTKFIKRDLDKITKEDMEKLIKALNENKLKKSSGQKFAEKTKSNIKITFISFLRYNLPEKKYNELTSWIETKCKEVEISALEEEEIKTLISKCPEFKHRVLIALLFATGSRIEEFLNIRLGDVTEVKGDVPYYRITLRNEFSKTQGRTFAILWTPANELLKEWLENHPNKDSLDSPLYPSTYDAIRMFMTRIGKKSIGKDINPHLFRHSSATYDASRGMDYFQLCKKYGWAIGSKMPQRYIDRSGIKERGEVEKFKSENMQQLKDELSLLKSNNSKLEEMQVEFQKKLDLVIAQATPKLQNYKNKLLKSKS